MNSKTTFSKNLRHFLEERGKTERQLATYTGVSDSTAARWIRGETMPRLHVIDTIGSFLTCSREDLLREASADKPEEKPMKFEHVVAREIMENPLLLELFITASKSSIKDIEACISLLKNGGKS